jgi:nitrite reductase/ring-hydroxylating ferredoxin subunit
MARPSKLRLEKAHAGPPAGTKLIGVEDLPEHGGKSIEFRNGEHLTQIFIQKFGDYIKVFENRCPHAGTPLNLFGDNFLDIEGRYLICRTHGAKFDPLSGECISGPCKKQFLREVAVKIADGVVYSE